MHASHRIPALLACALAAAACSSTPEAEPLRAPRIASQASHYAGDPIGGPLAQEQAGELEFPAADALWLSGRLYVVTRTPAEGLEPITDHVRMIIGGGGNEPLAPRSLLSPGTGLVLGEAGVELAASIDGYPQTEVVQAATFEGLSLPGVTVVFSATQDPIALLGREPQERTVRLDLWRQAPGERSLSVTLSVSDVVRVVEGLGAGQPAVTVLPREEQLVLDVTLTAEQPLVLVVPARFDSDARLAYVAVVEVVEPPPDDEVAGRLAVVEAEVQDAAAEGAERRVRLATDELARLRGLRSLEALRDPDHRRAALAELTIPGAPIAAELAVMADDELIDRLADRLLAQEDLLRELAASPATLAWRLEREVVLLFNEITSGGELPPEYTALLLRYTGEAGRFPGALESALEASADTAGFYQRVLEENRIALEDSSPAARLRAFDWLATQGIDVPDYDPLADRGERRSALRAWAAAEASAAPGEPGEAVQP